MAKIHLLWAVMVICMWVYRPVVKMPEIPKREVPHMIKTPEGAFAVVLPLGESKPLFNFPYNGVYNVEFNFTAAIPMHADVIKNSHIYVSILEPNGGSYHDFKSNDLSLVWKKQRFSKGTQVSISYSNESLTPFFNHFYEKIQTHMITRKVFFHCWFDVKLLVTVKK
jgi:hypothetical protein